MEVESGSSSDERRKGDGGGGERQIRLHPLAIISISDHCTRVSVGGSRQEPSSRIFGLLFGVQEGLDVSIYDAIECGCDFEGGHIVVNSAAVTKQKELLTAVYPSHELLGWYSVGSEATVDDANVQRQMTQHNESPVLLLLNPQRPTAAGAKELPVMVLESEVHVVGDQPTLTFNPLNFTLETALPEQISAEHVVKATPTTGISQIDLHASATCTSLRALGERLEVLKHFVRLVQEGKAPQDHRLLRQIAGLAGQLPTIEPGSGTEASLVSEYTDSLSVTYLAAVQKGSAQLAEAIEKFSVAHGDRHRRAM